MNVDLPQILSTITDKTLPWCEACAVLDLIAVYLKLNSLSKRLFMLEAVAIYEEG